MKNAYKEFIDFNGRKHMIYIQDISCVAELAEDGSTSVIYLSSGHRISVQTSYRECYELLKQYIF